MRSVRVGWEILIQPERWSSPVNYGGSVFSRASATVANTMLVAICFPNGADDLLPPSPQPPEGLT
jgi:hypothetical protein